MVLNVPLDFLVKEQHILLVTADQAFHILVHANAKQLFCGKVKVDGIAIGQWVGKSQSIIQMLHLESFLFYRRDCSRRFGAPVQGRRYYSFKWCRQSPVQGAGSVKVPLRVMVR
ncbi:hypothetical protein D3C81_1261970 [compost metagenome]